jgi:hypothetical protein
LTPVQVLTAGHAPLDNAVDIAAAGSYSCALTISGAVYCWGQWLMEPVAPTATEIPFP